MEICTHMNEAREENIKDFSKIIFNNMKRGQNMNILFTLKMNTQDIIALSLFFEWFSFLRS